MNKKKIILIIITILLVIAFIALTIFGINSKNDKPKIEKPIKEIKPKITEEYTTAELNVIKEYEDYLIYENKTAYYTNDVGQHIVYKNGILLNNEELVKNGDDSKYNEYLTFKKYDYYISNDYDDMCIKEKSNSEIECYDMINTISNYQDSIDYLLLKKHTNEKDILYLLNPNTGTLVDLSKINVSNIFSDYALDDEEGNMSFKEYDYLPACTNYEKCGLISYEGKIIIDFVYDSINYINKDFIIVTKNEKQGIINYKNAYKLSIDYDYVNMYNDYILTVKDFKLTVLNKDLTVLASNINVDLSESETLYNFELNTDNTKNLYLHIKEENVNHLYLINNKKLQRQINTKGTLEYLYDEKYNIKYITFTYEDNDKLYLIFYDSDLYEYYTFSKDIKTNIDYSVIIYENNKNKNYYNIMIYYDIDTYNVTYYIDLTNSKEIDELTALGKHFSNGYTYTITNDKLNIYKGKELLNSFEGEYTHLNEYTFIETKNGKSKIINVEFKKESREVE